MSRNSPTYARRSIPEVRSRLRIASRLRQIRWLILLVLASAILAFTTTLTPAQQTNPVDRKVTNPMTDTPNVNPLNPDQSVQRPPARPNGVQGVATDRIEVDATRQTASGPENARNGVYECNDDLRIGTYRLQADKGTVYEA